MVFSLSPIILIVCCRSMDFSVFGIGRRAPAMNCGTGRRARTPCVTIYYVIGVVLSHATIPIPPVTAQRRYRHPFHSQECPICVVSNIRIGKPLFETTAYLIKVSITRNRYQSYHAQIALPFHLRPQKKYACEKCVCQSMVSRVAA